MSFPFNGMPPPPPMNPMMMFEAGMHHHHQQQQQQQQQHHHPHPAHRPPSFGMLVPGLNDAPLEFGGAAATERPPSRSPSRVDGGGDPLDAASSKHGRKRTRRDGRGKFDEGRRRSSPDEPAPPQLDEPPPFVYGVYAAAAGAPPPPMCVGGIVVDAAAGLVYGAPPPPMMGAQQQQQQQPPPAPLALKEPIRLKTCTLVPPYPSAAAPTTRERPPGCRTVFVGGLPENATEEVLAEAFERCGPVASLRLSKKNFCHIRFAHERSVDAAVFLSGYRLRVDHKTDAANCARLHVDYAQARDDKHEWECKQRALQRAARHLERQTGSAQRGAPSPPPVHHYSDHEAAAVCEKIKQDENFIQAVQVVIAWLERGDCNKKNVNVFYSMIQSTNSHVRRLLNEKTQYDEEIQRAKDEAKQKMQGILGQFTQVERVFAAASHKKVWDHFTKAQRKNIDMWKKQSSEIRSIQLEDFLQESYGGEEMDCSDTDDAEGSLLRKRSKLDGDSLKEENDNLRCQLEAYKNEVHVLKSESQSDIESKNENIKQLQAQISLLESQLTQAKRAQASESVKLLAMEAKLSAMEKMPNEKATFENVKIKDDKESLSSFELNDKVDCKERICGIASDKEAKLIGIISTFLHIHPFGASTDYVWSYVQKMEPYLTPNQVEDLLRKFPTVFIQEMSGVGANIERKWVFNGLKI